MTQHGQSYLEGIFQNNNTHPITKQSLNLLIKNTEGGETQVKPKPTQAG